MSEQAPKEDILLIIKEIDANPNATQRVLSRRLDISLGKTNYLLRELIKKGLIKIRHFSENPGKFKKINYLLTEKGLAEKMQLTYHFFKKKETEYNLLKQEYDNLVLNGEKR